MYEQWQQQHWQHDRPGRTAADFNIEELSDDSPHGGQMVGLQRQGSREHASQQMLSLKRVGPRDDAWQGAPAPLQLATWQGAPSPPKLAAQMSMAGSGAAQAGGESPLTTCRLGKMTGQEANKGKSTREGATAAEHDPLQQLKDEVERARESERSKKNTREGKLRRIP